MIEELKARYMLKIRS